ncbi:MAG: hypothetical protein RSF34_11125 [Flavobacterium sp.]|uniref:hypothetical protein n=1 Tax=Flavobacterium sp. TaxID=239 RepID=UPI002FC710DB
MTNKIAIKIMLGLLSVVIIFHLCILAKIIPYEIARGGKLQSTEEMYVLEITSIIINLFLGFILLIKGGYIKFFLKQKILNFILWIFLILFILNTIGNIIAKSKLEKSFALLTLALAFLLGTILNTKRNTIKNQSSK